VTDHELMKLKAKSSLCLTTTPLNTYMEVKVPHIIQTRDVIAQSA